MSAKRSTRLAEGRFSIVYSRHALSGVDRIFDFLAASDDAAARRAIRSIVSGVTVLAEHPLVGRPVSDALRALVVSFGNSGYVVLYRVRPRLLRVDVLSVRHQREAGFG
jgi:plasmid stabilization system protein ParE